MKRIAREADTAGIIRNRKPRRKRARADTPPVDDQASPVPQSNGRADDEMGPPHSFIATKGRTYARRVVEGDRRRDWCFIPTRARARVPQCSHCLYRQQRARRIGSISDRSNKCVGEWRDRLHRSRQSSPAPARSRGVRKDVASPSSSQRLRSYYMVIEPGCGSGTLPYTHEGEELGIVLSGRLELEIDGERFSAVKPRLVCLRQRPAAPVLECGYGPGDSILGECIAVRAAVATSFL